MHSLDHKLLVLVADYFGRRDWGDVKARPSVDQTLSQGLKVVVSFDDQERFEFWVLVHA